MQLQSTVLQLRQLWGTALSILLFQIDFKDAYYLGVHHIFNNVTKSGWPSFAPHSMTSMQMLRVTADQIRSHRMIFIIYTSLPITI